MCMEMEMRSKKQRHMTTIDPILSESRLKMIPNKRTNSAAALLGRKAQEKLATAYNRVQLIQSH